MASLWFGWISWRLAPFMPSNLLCRRLSAEVKGADLLGVVHFGSIAVSEDNIY